MLLCFLGFIATDKLSRSAERENRHIDSIVGHHCWKQMSMWRLKTEHEKLQLLSNYRLAPAALATYQTTKRNINRGGCPVADLLLAGKEGQRFHEQ